MCHSVIKKIFFFIVQYSVKFLNLSNSDLKLEFLCQEWQKSNLSLFSSPVENTLEKKENEFFNYIFAKALMKTLTTKDGSLGIQGVISPRSPITFSIFHKNSLVNEK